MLLFAGEAFDTDGEHKRLKSLLIGKVQPAFTPDAPSRGRLACA